MKISVETVSNGYILRTIEENKEDEQAVIFERDETENHLTALVSLLWEINEQIGTIGSRYDEWRIKISLEHGDKWMSPEDWKRETEASYEEERALNTE